MIRPKRSPARRTLAALAFAALLAPPAAATDYYVARGSGCTAGYPRCGVDEPGREFDDLDRCAALARAGDTCWIKDGVYALGADGARGRPYQPRHAGEPGRPISFRAHPGHRPVFRGGGLWQLGVSGPQHHVVFSGLTVEGAIRVQGSSEGDRVRGVVIERCDISGGGGKNDGNWSGVFVQWAEDLVLRDNRIHDVRADGAAKGVSIFNGRRTLVEHNHIYGNPSEGIFDKEGGEDNVYRRNVFEDNGVHLKINNQADERGVYNLRTQIYENLFLCDRGGSGSVLMLSQPTAWRVYNNTGFECRGIEVRSNSGPAPAEAVYNNIWWRSERGKSMWTSQNGDDREPEFMDYNLYAPDGKYRENRYTPQARSFRGLEAWRAAPHPARYDVHSLEADPAFADPAARDFRLRPDSPARGAGRSGEDLGAWPRGDETALGPRAEAPAVGAAPPASSACAAPGALLCEDFESGRLDRRRWRDVELGGEGGAVLRVQQAVAAGGRFAAEGRAVHGATTDLWAAAGFGDHPLWGSGRAVEALTLEARLRWGEGFEFRKRGGAKIFIVGAFEDWSAGYVGPNAWSPYYLLLQWRRADKSRRPRELEGVLHRKTECPAADHAEGCSVWRALPANEAQVPLEAGRWYDVRLHLALNAPGRADGVLEAWVDGERVLAYDDVDYRGGYARHGLNQLMLSRRASAASPTQSLFWDELRVDAGRAPPPARLAGEPPPAQPEAPRVPGRAGR